MRRGFVFLALAASVVTPLAAQDTAPLGLQDVTPRVRARLDPGRAVTVGQPLQVIVDVLVPSYFMGAPRFSDVDVENSLVLFNDRGSNFTEREGSETWAGQQRSYTVYPQVPGDFVIDGISVSVAYFSGGRVEATAAAAPLGFVATLPDEAAGLGYFIAATRLRLDERYDPVPDTIRVGDAFSRTVTTTVDDALAMVVPPLPVDSLPGLSAYPDPPVVNDEGGQRGERVVGTRAESVTYVAVEPGVYTIPSVELTWWDVSTSLLRNAALPARSIIVIPNPDLAAAIALPPDSTEEAAQDAPDEVRVDLADLIRRFGPMGVGAALLIFLLVRLVKRWGPTWTERRVRLSRERTESERAYFRRFRDAARQGDPSSVARTFMAWLDRWSGTPGLPTAAAFVAEADDEELERQAGGLGQALFGRDEGSVSWSASVLTDRVEAVRRRPASKKGSSDTALRPLNP